MNGLPDVVPGYELTRPQITDLQATLAEVLGPREAGVHMSRALHELELDVDRADSLSTRELVKLSERLIQERGLVGVLARSFWIRLTNFEQLSPGGEA